MNQPHPLPTEHPISEVRRLPRRAPREARAKALPLGRGSGERPLRVLFVASEVTPFRKTGGLADVVGALPKALARRGVDVRVVMPLYQGIPWHDFERLDGLLSVPMYFGHARAAVRFGKLPGSDVPIYFVEHNRYFDRPFLYGSAEEPYGDNLERFSFFSRASLELSKALGFCPDVIHAHDWQTALVPVYTNTVEWGQELHAAATVFTLHNVAYQGVHDAQALFTAGLGYEHYHAGEFEHFGVINLLKAGIQHSTLLSTVSPTYAQEIQTPAYGYGLDGVLAARHADLSGILNGIDVDEWDPLKDPYIEQHYDADDLAPKAANKAALQRQSGLPQRSDLPLFAAIGRLTHQKGLDVLARSLRRILDWDLQMVLLGTGDNDAERFFAHVAREYPHKFRAFTGYDPALVHRIEAGSDFLIMPSRFEPCGLNQIYSLRYGTVPIVRATGGLVDTVQNFDERTGSGTGFVFQDLTADSLTNTVGWALATYFNRPDDIRAMRQRGMRQDWSWDRSAADYERLYLQAYERRRGHAFRALRAG